MTDYSVTRRILQLGAADTTTGWYAKDYSTETTIEMVMREQGATIQWQNIGLTATHPITGFTDDPISEGDEILDSFNKYYEVLTVEPITIGDSLYCYRCQLHHQQFHADRPSTSGTWHLDSGSAITDVRYRQKLWLQTYLAPASITKDDGVTQAPYTIQFAYPDYPLIKNFINKNNYLIFFIDTGESESLINNTLGAYAYHESVPIELVAVNKSDCTATNLIEKGYQDLRRIAETYPTGSVRRMGRMTTTTSTLGSTIMFSQKYMVEYERVKA